MARRSAHDMSEVPTHVTIPPPDEGELVPVFGEQEPEVVRLTVEREIAVVPLGKGGRPIVEAMFTQIGHSVDMHKQGGTFRFEVNGEKFVVEVDWS